MRNLICLIVASNMLLIGGTGKAFGYNQEMVFNQLPVAGSHWEIELDFMTSVNHDRDISTVSLNILKKTSIKTTYHFTRDIPLRDHGERSIIRTRYATVPRIGPAGMLRYQLRQFNRSSISLDMSGALIFYNEKFPAGGRHYNFMWRIGPKFIYQISENLLVNLGYKIMHVSNGSLSGYHNPAYDSEGFSFCLMKFF